MGLDMGAFEQKTDTRVTGLAQNIYNVLSQYGGYMLHSNLVHILCEHDFITDGSIKDYKTRIGLALDLLRGEGYVDLSDRMYFLRHP